MPSKPSFWTRQRETKGRRKAALTASGTVIDLRDRNVINTLSATKMAWQAVAWNYRDLIGELGAALRLKANIISKVQFVVAMVAESDDEPRRLTGDPELDVDKDDENPDAPGVPLLPQHIIDAAIDCLARLPFQNGYSFQGMISQSFDVAGECWLHARADDDGDEEFVVLSTSEVVPGTSGLSIMEVPGRPPRIMDPKTETLVRLWVPHPQWKQLADSPLRLMMDVCEDVVLAGREIRAAATSRIAANGLLLMPNDLSLGKRVDEQDVTTESDAFQANLTAAIIAPIANEGDAGAVAPVLIRGEAEDLKEVRHITLQRETSPEIISKQQAGLGRIADGINLPSEMMGSGGATGLGSVNHWTGWLIDASTFKNYIEPDVRLIADSLTMSYFRATLRLPVSEGGYGLTKDEALSVQIWYEAGNVTENANRSQDADDAMEKGAISFKAYRDAKGFGDDDAPDEEDLRKMQMLRATPTPDMAGQLATLLMGLKKAAEPQPEVVPGQIGQGPPAQIEAPPVGPGQRPAKPVPPEPLRASAVRVEPTIITGDTLAEIDKELRERIRQAGDDAVLRALEKAGNRIKAKVQGKSDLAALTKDAELADVGALIGQDRLAELGLAEDILLAAAFAALGASFAIWTAQAIKAAVKVAGGMVPMPLTQASQLAQAMNARIPSAWKRLEGSLRKRALDKLYGRAGDEMLGEVPDTIVLPGDIREALSEIGGGDTYGGGLATGDDLTRTISDKAEPIGFTWRYGITARVRAFEPHLHLAGKRFSGFDDPDLTPPAGYEWIGPKMEPGDHNGCMCDYVMAWALVEFDEIAQDSLADSPAMSAERMLADLDDAAGRRGTTAQRTRDQRDTILTVQENWINRKALT